MRVDKESIGSIIFGVDALKKTREGWVIQICKKLDCTATSKKVKSCLEHGLAGE